MNSKNSFKRKMFQLVLNILLIFTGTWSAIVTMASAVASFTNFLAEIDAKDAEAQQYAPKNYTANKKKRKREMADNAFKMRGKLSAWAQATGNTILLSKMKIAYYKLFRFPDTAAITNAQVIYDEAHALTPAQRTAADISDAEITALNDSIETFKKIPSPAQARGIRKQLNQELDQLFKNTSDFLKNSIDGLMYQFSGTAFYDQYVNVRPLHESHRHTTIEGDTVDASTGEDLEDVKVLISSADDNFEEMTDMQGLYRRQIQPDLDYNIKFTLPEYEVEEFDKVKLHKGQHFRLSVKLKKSTA